MADWPTAQSLKEEITAVDDRCYIEQIAGACRAAE
jgi:hypothetical protein